MYIHVYTPVSLIGASPKYSYGIQRFTMAHTYIHACIALHCIALQYITYITYIYPMMNNTSVNF